MYRNSSLPVVLTTHRTVAFHMQASITSNPRPRYQRVVQWTTGGIGPTFRGRGMLAWLCVGCCTPLLQSLLRFGILLLWLWSCRSRIGPSGHRGCATRFLILCLWGVKFSKCLGRLEDSSVTLCKLIKLIPLFKNYIQFQVLYLFYFKFVDCTIII